MHSLIRDRGIRHALERCVGDDWDGPTVNSLLVVFGISGGDEEGVWIHRRNSQTRFNFVH